ncbi:alpha/beta fold hydrolase [Mycobacterium paraterrae]|uniref:Alpha/beta hydrolase n=1 Tax=Mycobacterium paraterrae TaxID=577492 RepID=A0ABY3VFV8_9MYCO|nr:alpha/beta fold hydrolase [Mycobacterium paraterrae]UMB68310.1 alpha/beta hydrolase [Mycobacterium paraterrae]
MTSPEKITVEVPHLRFAALAWGPADGRLMLCLHGYPDTAWTWRQLGPHFAQHGFRVVAPFMRGYAPTELVRDGDYGGGALMSDAIALHQALGGGVDAVLIGHDWGGFTANAVAAYPDNPFEKVVSMGIPLIAGLTPGAGNGADVVRVLPRQARMSWYVLFQQLPGLSERMLDRVIPRLWRDWSPPGYDATADLAHVFEALPDRGRRTAALSYYRAQFRPLRRGRRNRHLDRYALRGVPLIPILFLHGHIDGAIDPRLGALGASALPAGSRHEIIHGAGHFMHLDASDVVHRLIADYISA